ncbi:MAG: hypothetical protein V3R73_06890 [Sphingomonadales bacterium]
MVGCESAAVSIEYALLITLLGVALMAGFMALSDSLIVLWDYLTSNVTAVMPGSTP